MIAPKMSDALRPLSDEGGRPRPVVVVKREDHHICGRQRAAQCRGNCYPVLARHLDIEDGDMRQCLAGDFYRPQPVRRLAHDGDIRFKFEQEPHALADACFVVDQDDADRLVHGIRR